MKTKALVLCCVLGAGLCRAVADDEADLAAWKQRVTAIKPGMKRVEVEPLLPLYDPQARPARFETTLSNGTHISLPMPPPPIHSTPGMVLEIVMGAHYIALYQVTQNVQVSVDYRSMGDRGNKMEDIVNSVNVQTGQAFVPAYKGFSAK